LGGIARAGERKNPAMNPLEYYRTQSAITEPGECVRWFDGLPHDISDLCRVVQGLIFPIDGEELYGYTIPENRRQEVDTRYVEKMLARIIELDERPLSELRPLDKRFVGCGRDMAVLFCAVARYWGIPARTRVGFAPYIQDFGPNFVICQMVAEYWDSDEERWCLVDPGQDELTVDRNNIRFDPTDIPSDQFVAAGLAWQMCRDGRADPDSFGEFPDTFLKGWWFIRANLVRDLAAQNRMELLLWDSWGDLMTPEPEPKAKQLALLDKVAILTQAGNGAFERMRAAYEGEAGLKVPPVITCYSFVTEPSEVTLP
jgi:hypothetical protein